MKKNQRFLIFLLSLLTPGTTLYSLVADLVNSFDNLKSSVSTLDLVGSGLCPFFFLVYFLYYVKEHFLRRSLIYLGVWTLLIFIINLLSYYRIKINLGYFILFYLCGVSLSTLAIINLIRFLQLRKNGQSNLSP
jgi:hypothetical protein